MAISVKAEELHDLFDAIWQRVRPLYAGQPKSIGSAAGLSLARAALQLAAHRDDPRLLIEAWHLMGRSLGANEEFEKAIPFYRQVISGLETIGDVKQAARLHLALISVLLNADHCLEAFEVAKVAEGLFEAHRDETGLARLYHNIANIYHRTDDHTRAREYYLKAYTMFQKLGDNSAIAHSCFNLGNVLSQLDRLEESDDMYTQSIQLSHDLGMTDLWTQASYNRTYLQYLRGRYSEALEGFSRLREQFETTGSLRHASMCDLHEAEIYLQISLSKDAAMLAVRAAAQFEKLGLRYEQAKASAFYGVALIQQRRFTEALQVFRASQEIFELVKNRYWIGLLDLYRAEAYLSLQRYSEAQVLAGRATAVFEQLAIPSRKIFGLVLRGQVSLALSDLEAAERYSTEIGAIIATGRVPLVLFSYRVLCAEIAERSHRPEEAQMHYEAAVQELEEHQAKLHHDDLRVRFFIGRHRAYDALVRLSLDGPDEVAALSSAYNWCERAHSRSLIELLSHCTPPVRQEVAPALLSRINRLREEINTQYARVESQSRPIASNAVLDSIVFKEQELVRALREVSLVDPEYASLHHVSIATLTSVQSALPQGTTLLEYFTSGDEILVFVISADGAKAVRRVCSVSRVSNLQERLKFQLEAFTLGADYAAVHADQLLETAKRHLHALYHCLVGPFASDILTPSLIVVPHGSLHLLPFHAFYDGENYLIDRFEISYAPSASVLKYCLEKDGVRDAAPLLVGVADEEAPMVAEEIAQLHRMFPNANVLQDEAATRRAFIDNGRSCSFLHIATHSVFRQDNPMFSSFKLADGWFTAQDLFSIACQSNLVTLSGCQSGMTEVTGADDLLGLMRGFLYAGARSLLVSLWTVNDEATTTLMALFYQEWQQGATKSTALRRAMLGVRDQHPNPFHWAPFVLVGNP